MERATPSERQNIPALSREQVAELVALGRQIENHYGVPQDIEWGYALGRFYILQSRPITTLIPPMTKEAVMGAEYNRTMFIEIFPDPLSPLFLSVIQPLFHGMLDFTFEALGFKPPEAIEAIKVFYNQPYFNRGYIAAALAPLSPSMRDELVSQIINPFGRHEEGMRFELSLPYVRMIARLLRFMMRFPDQLPRLVAKYRLEVMEVAALPLGAISDKEIVAHIRELVFGTASRLLNYDFLMIALITRTYQMLGRLLKRYFYEGTEELRTKLISGVTGNATMKANKALWDLAQKAKALPMVSDLLRRYGEREVNLYLERTPEGQVFLNELTAFLSEYGHREVRMDILYPTWGEDPSSVLSFVRCYLDADDAQSPHRQQARLVQVREELTEVVQERVIRDRFGRYLVWPIFHWVLKHTQVHTRERDTMHFELTRLFPPFRRLLLELGRRWAERGLIAQSDDIFFLSLDELGEVAELPHSMCDEVEERRAEFEASKRRPWPNIIRDGEEIYAEGAKTVKGSEGQLRGVAGSPGVVNGIACVIRGPEEFEKLKNGDILVAPLTNPVWTPLFAIAGGVVTEAGGILSHGAIVAREYGIPAVMGVAGVTKLVPEGRMVTIDGTNGIIYLPAEEAA